MEEEQALKGPRDTSFRTALSRLDAAGRLVKVRRRVDAHLELAGWMKRLDGDRALLFEEVAGAAMPVLGNFLGSTANVETAFGTDREGVRALMLRALSGPLPPRRVEVGPCQEVVHDAGIDLASLLPVLFHTPRDAGRFITAGVVVARDPETGVANASYHRLQLLGGNRTAIRLDFGRHLRAAYEAACRRGEDLPVAVLIGTDVALMHAAAFMGSQMPPDADELAAAGALRGEPLEVVACATQPLSVPAETEIVLEGAIRVGEEVHEGPFGEFVGYLSEAGPAPVLEVSAVTTRRSPLYHAINGFGRETIMLRKYVLEASALRALRAAVPIVSDVELTAGGLHRFHLVVAVHKASPQHEGLQRNAMLCAFSTLKDLDMVTVVDDDIDCHDAGDVEYAVATRVEASRDLVVVPGARGHEYVRVSAGGVAAKLGIDATVAYLEKERFARVAFSPVEVDRAALDPAPGSSRLGWLGGGP